MKSELIFGCIFEQLQQTLEVFPNGVLAILGFLPLTSHAI